MGNCKQNYAALVKLLIAVGIFQNSWSQIIPLKISGPVDNRIDILYIAEGFTENQMESFAGIARLAMEYRDSAPLAEPFNRYGKFMNYYRIDVISPEEGITVCNGPVVNNLFEGKGDCDRLGTVTQRLVDNFIQQQYMEEGYTPDWVNVILNSEGYYNSGGKYCVFSKNYYDEIALHEGGHSFHNLADEYGGSSPVPNSISNINMAVSEQDAQNKWGHWMGYIQKGFRGNQSNQVISVETDIYEGGYYTDVGTYRPTPNSKMNLVPDPYNMPSIEKIILDIYDIVDPVDEHLDSQQSLINPESLWVKVIDPEVLKVDWYMDGELLQENGGEVLYLQKFGATAGSHVVKAYVYDEIILYANSDNNNPDSLDWVRKGLEKLQQEIIWEVELENDIIAAQNIPHQQLFSLRALEQGAVEIWNASALETNVELFVISGKSLGSWLLSPRERKIVNLNEKSSNMLFFSGSQMGTVYRGRFMIPFM